MLRSVFLVRTAVQPRVSWRDVGQDGFDICIVLFCGCKNVWTLARFAQRNGREGTTRWHEGGDCTSAQETLENVADGLARWTPPIGVECGALVVTA